MRVSSAPIPATLWLALVTLLSLPLGSRAEEPRDASLHHKWALGGGLQMHFDSASPFEISKDDLVNLEGHLPGFREGTSAGGPGVVRIRYSRSVSGRATIRPLSHGLAVSLSGEPKLSADLVHLLYGAARLEWLRHGIYPVHSACLGDDQAGYALLVGPPASGKTSLTIFGAAHRHLKVFSGNNTLLEFRGDGLEAIAGTRTMTVRQKDISRWSDVEKVDPHPFGDRLAFLLSASSYSGKPRVPIKRIFIVRLQDRNREPVRLSSASALRTLYPYFIDKEREDVLVDGGRAFLDGSISVKLREELLRQLPRRLDNIPVYELAGTLENLTAFIDSELRSSDTSRKKLAR